MTSSTDRHEQISAAGHAAGAVPVVRQASAADLDAGSAPLIRPRPAWPRRAGWFLAAFAAVYVLAVWTAVGQAAENALVVARPGPPPLFDRSRLLALPPLERGSAVWVAGLLVLVAAGLLRGRWREAVAGAGIAVGTVVVVEAVHAVLPRPALVTAPAGFTGASFPSGTVAMVAGLSLGAAVVVPARIRPYAAAGGAVWLGLIAAAVQALQWHRPSDVIGTTLAACACHAVATGLLGTRGPVAVQRRRGLMPLAFAAVGALAVSMQEGVSGRALVGAGVAFGCSVVLWSSSSR
jgi:hypothetical protein